MATRAIPWSNEAVANLTRGCTYLLAVACILALPARGGAEKPLRNAHVVWVRDDRVYIASEDSVAFNPGTILTFTDRRKVVAAGEVTAIQGGELVAARLTSGSLNKVKHLDRLEITTAPPVVRGPAIMRIGFPAPGRKNLLFDCVHQSLDPSVRLDSVRISPLQGYYESELLDERTYRLVRQSADSQAATWPETLIVRLYDDVSDEEIALERGDLDAAVFWPGEASRHIKETTGWQPGQGIPPRGTLTALVHRPLETGETETLRDDEWEALERMNRELFRDDLSPAPGRSKATPSAPGRFHVDPSLPGHEAMGRYLNGALGTSAPIDTNRVIQIEYEEIWPTVRLYGGQYDKYGFAVRCTLISGARLRAYLKSVNSDAFANLFQCAAAARKP